MESCDDLLSSSSPPHNSWVIVVTGLPGSGKTTLGTAIASALGVPFLSLDTIKERLYESGAGGGDRYRLRMMAEQELAGRLSAAEGPSVVDMWIQPGRDTQRVIELFQRLDREVIEIVCRVPAEMAVARYRERVRHGPHLPADEATLQRIREAAEALEPLGLGRSLEVDTSTPVDIAALCSIRGASD